MDLLRCKPHPKLVGVEVCAQKKRVVVERFFAEARSVAVCEGPTCVVDWREGFGAEEILALL